MNAALVTFILFVACATFANGLRCYYSPWSRYPFNPGYATIVTTTNRYCAKKSYSSDPRSDSSRGIGDPTQCTQSGCWTIYEAQRYVYLCCCTHDLCNTGSFTSKSTLSILFGALTLLVINRYF